MKASAFIHIDELIVLVVGNGGEQSLINHAN
jgi:hypothetical protein